MVGSDGGVFAFGDAQFAGSMGAFQLDGQIVTLVPDPDGTGYWLIGSDGGVFAFEAPFVGSVPAALSGPMDEPATSGIAFDTGCLVVAADGGIFNVSARPFHGSMAGQPLDASIIAVAASRG